VPDLEAELQGLNPYIAFVRDALSGEPACLVFAKTARRAKTIAWPIMIDWGLEWTDLGVRRLRDLPEHLWKLNTGIERCIDGPPVCERCEIWGGHPTEDGRCSECESDDNYG